MTARLYDLGSHPSRRGRTPKLFIAPPCDSYARLAEETAAALAAVRAAIPDGRSSRALRERLGELADAITIMASTELAAGAIYAAGASAPPAPRRTPRRTAPRRADTALRPVDGKPDGAA